MLTTKHSTLTAAAIVAIAACGLRAQDDPDFTPFAIYEKTAPRAAATKPVDTTLPLRLEPGARIAFIGNTLLERAQDYGQFEALLHQRYPQHRLVVRTLAWSADEIDLQPRPLNFADLEQHLTHEKVDVIFAAFGFNESFAGAEGLPAFREALSKFLEGLKSKAFNGKTAPRVVLISPIANENVVGVPAAQLNNKRLASYVDAMAEVSRVQKIGFADVFEHTQREMASPGVDLTINGIHLTEKGYRTFAEALYRQVFGEVAPPANPELRKAIVERNRQYFRRFRPVNTFYYTGSRNRSYGYLDFLPAMRNFDIMVANRDKVVWSVAQGGKFPEKIDDSNVPPLPRTKQSRSGNKWMSAADELKAFRVDPRFEVNLFAGEEQFPDVAAPIQIRWDSKGRLWVSCSTTYPHVYPGHEPNDKLVILEDTDGDGRADRSSVFADDLHIPLSFEFGDGGVYVSEMPYLTFLKDTDGDGKADLRRQILAGFGTEDSHHALHDIAWTPDGDMIFREAVFHHSQVETPYGPVRQRNSGWFLFEPSTHRLTSFGTYSSTNPWGVTFDDWGQHIASHPIYASAFWSLDPPYPQQHPRPSGLRAYSGTCGQEIVDFDSFPEEMQGGYVKVRYKPTNRVEFHEWKETEFGFDEQYVGDIIFSTNLSFIPVDVRFGPRGAMYVCDWYNPIKGHAQYSLRDDRRDRHSGRIWRITAKGRPLQTPPKFDGASVPELLDILKRKEYRYRYWAKRELREADSSAVKSALDAWVARLDKKDARYRQQQVEALWLYRDIGVVNAALLREVLSCDNHMARAAATRHLRRWHSQIPDAVSLLRPRANDANAIVRMEAAITSSWIGTREALDVALDVAKHPRGGHLDYALTCALGSKKLRKHWEGDETSDIAQLLQKSKIENELKEPIVSASEAQFDAQDGVKAITISCIPERMLYSVKQFAVTTGQPVKLVFTNPDATDHNLLIVKPGALEEVGMAANEMAKDPRNANSNFIPRSKRHLIIEATPMIGPTRTSRVHVLRFNAPKEPGIYPYVCTFPGHWVVMYGEMVVARDLADVEAMVAAAKPKVVKEWKLADFAEIPTRHDERSVMRGAQAFKKAKCNQCHVIAGHGVELGPDLTDVAKRYTGAKLLRQILEPSTEIHEKYQSYQFITNRGQIISGVIKSENRNQVVVRTNLLNPRAETKLRKRDLRARIQSKISAMPTELINVLTREEIIDMLGFLEKGGYHPPEHLKRGHQHGHGAHEKE